jgi:dTDP-4-amino-4,6-dideoxygalactose transaminase
VVTRDARLAARIRSLSNHGRDDGAPDQHSVVGANHRLDAIQAAILSAKLPHLDSWNRARRRIAKRYGDLFQGTAVGTLTLAPGAMSSHHLAIVQVDERDEVRRTLAAAGVGTGIHYAIPCHRQPAFRNLKAPPLPVVEQAAKRILSLPLYPHLTDGEVERVADAVIAATSARGAPQPIQLQAAATPAAPAAPVPAASSQ